jgi:hypothetical protein
MAVGLTERGIGMRGKRFGERLAALLLALGPLGGAGSAAALEVELPGERKAEIHGFYETRLQFFGEDAPANGMTFSVFRHVVNLETDIEMFPDGVGPFDTMVGYTRWIISYECIYEHACATFDSADSFGGDERDAEREPQFFKHARTRTPFIGGVYPQLYYPRTLRTTRERITPGERYRGILNPDGVFTNPFPLAAFANLNQRSFLDPPVDQGSGLSLNAETRGGAFHPNGQLINTQLIALRRSLPSLTGHTFEELIDRDVYASDGSADGLFPKLSNVDAGLVAGTLAQARRADADPAKLARYGISAPQGVDSAALREQVRVALFENPEFLDDQGNPKQTIDSFTIGLDDSFPASQLVRGRSDPNKFVPLALANEPGLLTMEWGATARADGSFIPWITSLDTHVNSLGYFSRPGADTINEYGTEVALPTTLVTGVGTSYCKAVDPSAPCLDPQIATPGARGVAVFFGPDGKVGTADDLPVCKYSRAVDPTCSNDPSLVSDPSKAAHPLYVTQDDQALLATLAQFSGKVAGLKDPNGNFVLVQNGKCLGDGVNANGDCIIQLGGAAGTAFFGGQVMDPETVVLQGDTALRPSTAALEPTDGLDLLARGRDGRSIPARPKNPASGLAFPTAGMNRTQLRAHSLVSSLDLQYTEDELRWEHGAGQDENEFREGYVEFEMMDSELFARGGKLLWVWGKTELFRNQDRLNPLDLGLGALARLEEARMGQWGIQLVYSPEAWMTVGPVEDMRLEFVTVVDDFEPTDLGECGEPLTFEPVCFKTFGAMAGGLAGLGLMGEVRPDLEHESNFLETLEYGVRLEGRWDRFTFALTDYWGWDDGAVLEVVHTYGRRVDPETGAPLRVAGPPTCTVRKNAAGVAIGPDGVAGTNDVTGINDDLTPSVGNCLLYDNPSPSDPNAPQSIRASDGIALDHYANQTLFHTICTLTFDEDTGYCALDQLTAPALTTAISQILAGGSVGSVAIQGSRTIRRSTSPFAQEGTKSTGDGTVAQGTFGRLRSRAVTGQDSLDNMDVRQRALLGCGDSFGTLCGGTKDEVTGSGIDFMNADASVLTQEFTTLKVGSAGALIGTRKGYFEAGITRPRDFTINQATALVRAQQGSDPNRVSASDAASDLMKADGNQYEIANGPSGSLDSNGNPLVATPQFYIPVLLGQGGWKDAANLTTSERNSSQLRLLYDLTDPASLPLASDFQIEGMRWLLDPNAPKGVILFQDPRLDPSNPGSPLDPTKVNPFGENCASVYGGPEPGCTDLEILSANFERFLMTNEIIGDDDNFEPPESFDEIMAMLDGNPANDAFGDPISGPDGIFFNNYDLDGDGIADRKAIRVTTQLNADFVGNINGCTGTRFCYQQLARDTDGTRLVHAMPIGIPGFKQNASGGWDSFLINTDTLDRLDVQRLTDTDETTACPPGVGACSITSVDTDGDGTADTNLAVNSTTIDGRLLLKSVTDVTGAENDPDGDQVNDLDEDRDGKFDFLDDGTIGPISDDNILCGSGLPGDRLQDALQVEYANQADAELTRQEFGFDTPSGLPPRSPVFCAGITGLAGVTGQTLPYRKAGGDGAFGRRDFLWHGGRQAVLSYQKKNVMGFSLDFAEDRTKSSWGVEFSWQADKEFPDSTSFDGLHSSNEYLLTVSVDRPTFFNFLNPNRSFFLNFQMNIRYLDDYVGGKDDEDGMFAVAEGPLTGFFVFTFFTGYFQDRLLPTFNFVVDPFSSTGGILSQVAYRWTESFSTSVRLNHFFGHPTEAEGGYFPIALYNNPQTSFETTRGLSVVKNRDVAIFTIRYSF